MARPTFNLIDEPWIGAVDHAGSLQQYSLRELLVRAHELNGLYDDSPLVVAALLRMTLALLHRVHDGPRSRGEWQTLWQARQFDASRLDGYFDEWRERFDIFDYEHPFYQCVEPLELDRTASVAVLIHELSSGDGATLFDHTTTDSNVGLDPARAARVLLTVQLYGFSGRVSGPAYFKDGPCVRDILFFAEGASLFETLLLNLLQYPGDFPMLDGDKDCPTWERANPYEPDRQIPFGYLDFLTWPDRRIRLVPEQAANGLLVAKMALAPGLSLDETVLDHDPMKHYRIDEVDGRKALRFREDRALWRDSATLLQIGATDRQVPAVVHWLGRLSAWGVLDERHTMRFMAYGMATKAGQAVVHFYRSEHLPLPLTYLDKPVLIDLLSTALAAAENVASELWKATGTMASVLLAPDEGGERRANPDDVRDLRANMAAERRYWAMLEPLFRTTMQAIPHQGSEAVIDWFGWLRRAAWIVFDEVSDGLGDDPRALKATVRGREQLARGLGKVLKIE